MDKKNEKKITTKKKSKKVAGPVVTDVLEERFLDDEGNAKVKRTHLNKKKVVKEEILND